MRYCGISNKQARLQSCNADVEVTEVGTFYDEMVRNSKKIRIFQFLNL